MLYPPPACSNIAASSTIKRYGVLGAPVMRTVWSVTKVVAGKVGRSSIEMDGVSGATLFTLFSAAATLPEMGNGSATCTVPLLKVVVTVAPASSRPETLPDSLGPPGPVPLTLLGSMSIENPKVSPESKSLKLMTNVS